ncbi:MAG: hypothetical protein M3R38_16260 [Actinomycetota bacterium]|nr:hypothetical protein [Actinomycetota bacterium]
MQLALPPADLADKRRSGRNWDAGHLISGCRRGSVDPEQLVEGSGTGATG